MRLRVEELAERADVSVDTIRFYQKRHLLAPPQRVGRVAWYGPEHLERLARIRDLQTQGPAPSTKPGTTLAMRTADSADILAQRDADRSAGRPRGCRARAA